MFLTKLKFSLQEHRVLDHYLILIFSNLLKHNCIPHLAFYTGGSIYRGSLDGVADATNGPYFFYFLTKNIYKKFGLYRELCGFYFGALLFNQTKSPDV